MIPAPPALQAPAPTSQAAPAAPVLVPVPATAPAAPAPVPLPFASVRAKYKWSLRDGKESGSGTLVVLLAPASGKLVLEVFSYGDRLALVDGDTARGYQVVLPREQVNRTVPTLAELPLPLLPQAGSVEALARALGLGEGEGLSVEDRDAEGPLRLRYRGQDDAGHPVEVQLIRKLWEPAP